MPHHPARGLDQMTFSFPPGRRPISTSKNTSMKFYKSLPMHYFIYHNKQHFLILILQEKRLKRPEKLGYEPLVPWEC